MIVRSAGGESAGDRLRGAGRCTMWHGYYVSGGWFFLLLGLLFWGSIIALIVWAVRRATTGRGEPSVPAQKRPLDYLKERYARGDIDRDEYERVKDELTKE